MKAIKLTKKVKEANPKLFASKAVGDVFAYNPPKVFVSGGKRYFNYNKKTELHAKDGFKELTTPANVNYDTHKLGDVIKVGVGFTYEVVALTEDELDAKIPSRISKLAFKTALLESHNISNGTVEQIFAGIEDENLVARLRLMWYEADFFEIDNPYLYQFAPALGITEEQIIKIFKNYGNA